MAETKEQDQNTVANLEAEEAKAQAKAKANKKSDKLTDDGKKHKQGDVIKTEAFGVVIETKF